MNAFQFSTKIKVVVSIVCVFAIYWWMTACQLRRDIYLLPKGSSGWFAVVFGQNGWPDIADKNNSNVYHFGTDKLIITSTIFKEGESREEYYFLDGTNRVRLLSTPTGGGGQVWGRSTFSYSGHALISLQGEYFFIGSEAAFHQAGEEGFEGLLALARKKLQPR